MARTSTEPNADVITFRVPPKLKAALAEIARNEAKPVLGSLQVDGECRPSCRFKAVPEDELQDGVRLLAQTTGIFTETAGGVTTAALRALAERGDIDADERIVLLITGAGLKTLDAMRGTFAATEIEPTLAAFDERFEPELAAVEAEGRRAVATHVAGEA